MRGTLLCDDSLTLWLVVVRVFSVCLVVISNHPTTLFIVFSATISKSLFASGNTKLCRGLELSVFVDF
jgi:hypothetical protein